MLSPRPDLNGYWADLEEVCAQLSGMAEQTCVRGSDIAQFARAENGNRSVAISWCDNGVYVELWQEDVEAHELVVESYDDAIRSAQKWLTGG